MILGAFTPPPQILAPVRRIPLETYIIMTKINNQVSSDDMLYIRIEKIVNQYEISYQAAPTTDKAIAKPIPVQPHINGEEFSKNLMNTQSMLCIK